MLAYQEEFIDFLLEKQALKFGSFTLKSGRQSPFFMNTGAFITGKDLVRLASFYAQHIHEKVGVDFDVLFGPAYKGIPLAVAVSMQLYELYGKEVRYCANRKEVKDHGDTGILLGSPLKDGNRVLMIEDVTTSGASMEETVPIVQAQADVEIVGLVVSVNRQEKGLNTEKSALKMISDRFGFSTSAIVTMDDIRAHCDLSEDIEKSIEAYYKQYGAKA